MIFTSGLIGLLFLYMGLELKNSRARKEIYTRKELKKLEKLIEERAEEL